MTVTVTAAHSLQNRTLHRAVLNNGIVVLAVENPAADIVAARLFVRAGSACELPDKAGVAHLLSAVLLKGTLGLSAQDIAEQVESVGASLGADAASDYCLLSLKTVSGDFAEIFQLAARLVRSPSFPEAEVELERRLTLQGIRSMQEQPFAIAQQQLRQVMYPNHPYGLSSVGTEATVSQLQRQDLIDFHRTYFRPDNLVISIVGRIVPEEVIALVDQVLGGWHPGGETADEKHSGRSHTISLPQLLPNPQTAVTVQDTQQAIVMLGYLAAPVHDPDYMPLKLLSTYLGNGLSSRLFVELREKRGLAYDVSAFYPTRLGQSQFVVYMGTAPSNVEAAISGLQQEVDRLSAQILPPEELQAAKNKLLGQYALGKQTNAQIAQIFGWYEMLGLGVDFDDRFQTQIATITPEQTQAVAHRYLTQPYRSLVGIADAVNRSVPKSI